MPPISHLHGVHLAKFTPFLPHFNNNCLEKIFPSPWGLHLHPLHPLATPVISGHAEFVTGRTPSVGGGGSEGLGTDKRMIMKVVTE